MESCLWCSSAGLVGRQAAPVYLVPGPDTLQTLQSFLSPVFALGVFSSCSFLLRSWRPFLLSVSRHPYSISSPSFSSGPSKLHGSFVLSPLRSESIPSSSIWPQCLVPPRRGNCGMLVLSRCVLHVSLLITLHTKALDVISAPCLNHLLWGLAALLAPVQAQLSIRCFITYHSYFLSFLYFEI